MRVLFDAVWWEDGPPSGRGVVRSVLKTWREQYPEDEIGFLSSSPPPEDLHATYHRARLRQQAAVASLEAGRVAKGYDAVVTQNFAARSSAVSAVFVHDVIFKRHPEWFTRKERAYLGAIKPLSARADVVLTSTEHERKELVRHLGVDPSRAVAVGLALPEDFARADPIEFDLVTDSGFEGFLLTVGRLNRRKNIGGLIRALVSRDLLTRDRPLIIVGQPDGLMEVVDVVKDAVEGGRVHFTGGVSTGHLRWLYKNASAFIFPSFDEGFGLPLLEASASRTPILASRIAAFEEVLRDTPARFFDPNDEQSIGETVATSDAQPLPSDPISRYNWRRVVDGIRGSLKERL